MELTFAKNRIFLAPLAGITDRTFRYLCKKAGAGFAYTEMVSAKGIEYQNQRTRELLSLHPEEGRIGIQLFGSEPEILARTAAEIAEEYAGQAALIDINMGCPAPKIVNNGEGSALLKRPELAAEIVKEVKRAVPLPVSVKFRKGFFREEDVAEEFAKRMEDAGVDVLTIHGRTREQYYEGKADWDCIARVKRAVSVPVIGNGDVWDGPSAAKMIEQTGCDGVMVARGALGNPFIFREIGEYLKTGKATPAPVRERLETAILHAQMLCEDKGEKIGIKEMRKHAAWYIKGMRGAARMRERLVRVDGLAELQDLITACIQAEEK